MKYKPYPKYKESGVEWLGEIPEGWDYLRGKCAYSLVTDRSSTSDFRIGLENITSGSSSLIETETEFDSEGVGFRVGDVLFGKLRPYLAKVWVANRDGEAVGDFFVLRPVTGNVSGYIKYLLLSEPFIMQADGSTFGAKMPRVGWDFMASFLVPQPNGTTQQAIAAFLDAETARIDGLIKDYEDLIELLKEKRQALISWAVTRGLSELVSPDDPEFGEWAKPVKFKDSGVEWIGEIPEGWKAGKCRFYISILSGFAFPSSGFTSNESDTKLLRGINVGVSALRWDETVYWHRTTDDGLDIYDMKEGDLVIGMDRPLISDGMRVAKVSAEDLPCLLLQRVAKINTGSQLDKDYLLMLLSSELFVAHFSPDTTGVSVPHISPEQVYSFVIPVPPLHTQQNITSFLDRKTFKIDTLVSESESAIELLKEHRSALITNAVTGKINVENIA